MARNEHSKSLEPNAQLLYSYSTTPQEDRGKLLAALKFAAANGPTADELHMARQRGGSGKLFIESRYIDLVDAYAKTIDKNFDPKRALDSDPQTVKKRENLYWMIRPLTADQIGKCVTEILRNEPKSTPQE
jgi:hypothetical protein